MTRLLHVSLQVYLDSYVGWLYFVPDLGNNRLESLQIHLRVLCTTVEYHPRYVCLLQDGRIVELRKKCDL